jgi:hypothetical protein
MSSTMAERSESCLLVEKDLVSLSACHDRLLETFHAERIGPWALEEAAVASDHIAHAILCRSVEL